MKTLDQRIEWLQERISYGLSDTEKDYIKFQMKDLAIGVSKAALENAAKNVKTWQQFTGTINITQVNKSSITDERNIPKI